METEVIYLDHNNRVDLQLKADGSAVSLSSVTKITASFENILISNTVSNSGTITWSGSGYDTGEVRLDLGDQSTILAGRYDVPIVVYTVTETDGIVWDTIPIYVKADPEAS